MVTTSYAPVAFSIATPVRLPLGPLFLGQAMRLARNNRQYAPLQALGTLHLAGFSMIYWLADRYGLPGPLSRPFLLFASLFDGASDQYLADFGTLVPDNIDVIWEQCLRYPGARSGAAFVKWLDSHQFTDKHEKIHAYAYNAPAVDGNGRPAAQGKTSRTALVQLVLGAVGLLGDLLELRARKLTGSALLAEFDAFASLNLRKPYPRRGAR